MPIPHEAVAFQGHYSFAISFPRDDGTTVMTEGKIQKISNEVGRLVQESLDTKVSRLWELTGHLPGELCIGVGEADCNRIISRGDTDWPGLPGGKRDS